MKAQPGRFSPIHVFSVKAGGIFASVGFRRSRDSSDFPADKCFAVLRISCSRPNCPTSVLYVPGSEHVRALRLSAWSRVLLSHCFYQWARRASSDPHWYNHCSHRRVHQRFAMLPSATSYSHHFLFPSIVILSEAAGVSGST